MLCNRTNWVTVDDISSLRGLDTGPKVVITIYPVLEIQMKLFFST